MENASNMKSCNGPSLKKCLELEIRDAKVQTVSGWQVRDYFRSNGFKASFGRVLVNQSVIS